MDLRRAVRSLRGAPWVRGLRAAFLATAGLFLLYLLVANVILRTRLLRGWLDERPEDLFVEYASAWSLYPGHVAVRGLVLRHQDANIQLQLGLERASIHLSLWALTRRTLRVARIDAEGGTFRLRHKSVSPAGNEGRIRAFPRIEGFADPPLARPEEPNAKHQPWAVELTDIVATMREVWTMEYRYQGQASVTGGFRIRPRREVSVSPSVMITHGGVLSLGEHDLIRGGEGRVEATLDPFDPGALHGIDILRRLSGSVQQTGELATLASIADTYFPGRAVHLEQGAGPIEINTRLEHGVFQPGSRATYRSPDAVLTVGPIAVRGDVVTVAHVEGSPEAPAISAELTIRRAGASPTPVADTPRALQLEDVQAAITIDTADLVRVPEARVARAATSWRSAHVADLRAWQPIAPRGWSVEGGAATLAGRAVFDGGRLAGRLDATLTQVRLSMSTFGVTASGKVGSDVASADITEAIAFPGATADLEGIAVRLHGGHSEGLWLRARSRALEVTTAGSADAEIAIESGPGARTIELFSRMAHVPDVAADATSGTELRGRLHLRVRPQDVSLTVMEAKNGALEGRGRIRRTAAGTSGAFLVSVGPFRAGLEVARGGVSLNPVAGSAWLEEKLRQR
ncbi:hypothetical protein BH11MYX4_BH11MYX4_25930 [soil metagenome]